MCVWSWKFAADEERLHWFTFDSIVMMLKGMLMPAMVTAVMMTINDDHGDA